MDYHTALFWLDNQSDLFHTIKKVGKLGVLEKLGSNNPAQIIAKFNRVSTEDQKIFSTNPAYISAFDIT